MMNKFLLLCMAILFAGCSSDFEEANLRINHFQKVGIGLGPRLVLQVQEDEEIGTEQWYNFYNRIIGFEYELGFIYNLKVKKTDIDNPPEDASSIRYELIEVISKEKVADSTSFEIELTKQYDINYSDPEIYVNSSGDGGFKLLNSISIDCGNLCSEFSEFLKQEPPLAAVFTHAGSEEYKLKKLNR
jgi:hypothetical protein